MARSNTLAARTRALFRQLDGYEEHRVSMLGLAVIWDDLGQPVRDRLAAHDRWWVLFRELSARIAEDAKAERSWASQQLKAI